MGKTRGKRGAAAVPGPRPEFSRPLDVSRIGRLEHHTSITANVTERMALARRFDLLDLSELVADVVLRKRGDGVIEAQGRLRARLSQACVVTLDPVPATIDQELRLFFSEAPPAADADPLDDERSPDRIEDGVIDLGEAVAQQLALALDPYPRSPMAARPD